MNEYGGYLNLDMKKNIEYYHNNVLCFNTASNALIYFLKAKKINRLYIPYYLCDSVSISLNINNINYEYYHIDKTFKPIINFKLKKSEYIYIVNYFGKFNSSYIYELSKNYKRIIVDNVQSFFQKPVEGVATVYSCRKYFGVPDGAYLYAKGIRKNKLEQDNSYNRYKHIIGRLDDNAANFYSYYKNNEENLINEKCKYMSNSTHAMLANIDYNFVKKKRNVNYKVLEKNLSKFNNLTLNRQNGPYCYPLYVNNGSKIKKELINKRIYVPVLWPNVLELDDCIEKDYAENILPIPCDQRYDEKDMKYVSDIVICLIKKYNK